VAPIRATFSIEQIIDMQLITVFRIVNNRICDISLIRKIDMITCKLG
jgi:hypothetical protein